MKEVGGGLIFIIHNSIQFSTITLPSPQDETSPIEQHGIEITSGTTKISIANIYIPPASSCSSDTNIAIDHLLNDNLDVILGDINAHHPLWFSIIQTDTRGNDIADQINDSNFGILNDQAPTRSAGDVVSSPDITLVHPNLLMSTNWSVQTALGSDHLPIIIEFQRDVEKEHDTKKTYVNFAKANWLGFTTKLEELVSHAPPLLNMQKGERNFRRNIVTAAKEFIPAGCIREKRPNFPTEAAEIAEQRDNLRRTDPTNPNIRILSNQVNNIVRNHLRDKWRSYLDKCEFNQNTNNLWRVIKRLSNKTENNGKVNLKFQDRTHCYPKQIAHRFNTQFTAHPTTHDNTKKKLVRKAHKLSKTSENLFTVNQVAEAIREIKPSKALGPDEIAPIMLKNIGNAATSYLTDLLNLSVKSQVIPNIWKVGRIIPILKPGKPSDHGSSYRPISLLSPIAKLLEKLLLPIITENVELAEHQHGFRKLRSTTTALQLIQHQIQHGLNARRPHERTVMIALDMSKAFDTVSHSKLIDKLLQSTIPPYIVRWITNYLQGRQTYVDFRGVKSKQRKVKQGVPQGGVLSPFLFNLYLRDLPTPPDDIQLISYADDCTILATGTDITRLSNTINQYLESLSHWLREHSLELSPGKSSATLFTLWTREVNRQLDIFINNERVPMVKNPKILGVVFDPLLTFNRHTANVRNRVVSRNNVLKSIAGSTWGKDAETLSLTYKTIGRSIINYAAPIFAPELCPTNWTTLQRSQNSALRIITGCHAMSSESHLHEETSILTVQAHTEMLSQQYVLKCLQPQHPNHRLTQLHPPHRQIRKSAITKYSGMMNNIPPPVTHRELNRGIKQIHTDTVRRTTTQYDFNRVLGTRPPPIDPSEITLPRETRSTLSQLRSGWCRLLESYRNKIDENVPNICPNCYSGPHDTRHLFECSSSPTTLQPIDLWLKPIDVAIFLNLKTNDDEQDDNE